MTFLNTVRLMPYFLSFIPVIVDKFLILKTSIPIKDPSHIPDF
jgi:hypothetical protein